MKNPRRPLPRPNRRSAGPSSREGSATVEFALICPFLTLLVLGAIDVGQYANANQIVSNASREGARLAAKFDTATATEVEAKVLDYLDGPYPGLSTGVQVTVNDSSGSLTSDLTTVESGSPIVVTVNLEYDRVRWLSATNVLAGRTISISTRVRRE